MLERVRAAIRRLGELGSPEAVLDRAAAELGAAADADRLLISQVLDGRLRPRAVWSADEPGAGLGPLADASLELAYPIVEIECLADPRARVVDVATAGGRSPAVLRDAFGWARYVVAGLSVEGHTIGLLHLERSPDTPIPEQLEREIAERCADGLAAVFEIAVLRSRVGEHRDVQWASVRWIAGRLELAEAADTGLDEGFAEPSGGELTRRERDVVELLAQGMTNAAIATALTISDGTVKYHLGNAFRKLHATSRADAVARYLRGG